MTKATITISVSPGNGRTTEYTLTDPDVNLNFFTDDSDDAVMARHPARWHICVKGIVKVLAVTPDKTECDAAREAKRELAIKYAKLGSLRRQKEALEKEIRALAFDLR